MKKLFRLLGKILLALLVLLLLALPFVIRPLDDTPYTQTDWYRRMMGRLDSLAKATPPPLADSVLQVGWAAVNITPAYAVPTAGYGQRKGQPISTVHDSLYVRALWLQQGSTTAAIVSADLLIIPPEVTLQVKRAIATAGIGWNNVYIGATHTHNSVGGWGKRYIGQLFAGPYQQEVVNNLAAQIIQAIDLARRRAAPARLLYEERPAGAFVANRVLGDTASEYDVLHSLWVLRQDGTTASLQSFAAHATTLSDSVMRLSRDFPGRLTDALEQSHDFAMYLAGAVGSMGPVEPAGTDWQQLQYMADGMAEVLKTDTATVQQALPGQLRVATLPLEMREPQWRFANNWCFRHWLWQRLYGDYAMEVKALKIGPLLLVGLPCDFGGELMTPLRQYAASKGKLLMVTSFNGGYCGYITPDNRYYDEGYETRVMNWFGPGNAAYLSEVVRRLVDAM
ncbi:MAG: neutral/alkaline non-lysosomal ceramidase N-terminal domain-containing protein [Chitinophagaceae bacterium]|nr:neutral/alkaline non-lysosomal ceramidase N-terminal domain-containing protein [Chitinophagaceae bacterium]